MPPDHGHSNGSVNLDDAESVMREIVSRITMSLRRVPGRETWDRTVPLAEPTADPGTELNFALLPYHPAHQAQGTR